MFTVADFEQMPNFKKIRDEFHELKKEGIDGYEARLRLMDQFSMTYGEIGYAIQTANLFEERKR